MQKEFTEIGYPTIDILLDELSNYLDKIEIEYPLDSFVVDGTLFRLYTKNKDTALKSYSQYKKDIPLIEKEIDRLYKMVDDINNKFCNERWLTRCPKDIVDKEYKKLCDTEEKLDAKVAELLDKKYIAANIKINKL